MPPMSNQVTRPTDAPDPNVEFALKLGRALHVYGTPAHRLERSLQEIAQSAGIAASFFSTPTAIFSSFESRTGQEQVFLQRIETGDVDLGKLADLDRLAGEVARGERILEEASAEVDRIVSSPPRYGMPLTLMSFGLTSAAASRFFGAGPSEMAMSLVVGLAVGVLAILAQRVPAMGRLFDPTAGLVVSFLAVIGAAIVGPLSVPVVTIAGLIVLVPGLTLTIAVSELAERSLVSGTARLHGALLVFLMLGFGVAVGGKLGTLVTGAIIPSQPSALSGWTEVVAILVAGLTLTILFKAAPSEVGWIIGAGGITYATVRFASPAVGPELGVFFGAIVIGVVSNLHSRFFNRPTAVIRLPGMMLLVPGGLGFLSISSLLEQDVLTGIQTAFRVAIIAVALVTGLIIANAIVPLRRGQRVESGG